VIASHYAEPVERAVAAAAPLRSSPPQWGEIIRELRPGERFLMLDDSLGWAWGYAGDDCRVGYVRSDVLTAQ
jgi:hypothetical protein